MMVLRTTILLPAGKWIHDSRKKQAVIREGNITTKTRCYGTVDTF